MDSTRSDSPYETEYGFSRAVRTGSSVHVSGTGPVQPDGSCPKDPRAQAERCFAIIAAALDDLGASLDDVVRTRMFVTDRTLSDTIGRAHANAFGHVRPAATMVVVAGLVDPRWVVEVEADAVVEAH